MQGEWRYVEFLQKYASPRNHQMKYEWYGLFFLFYFLFVCVIIREENALKLYLEARECREAPDKKKY